MIKKTIFHGKYEFRDYSEFLCFLDSYYIHVILYECICFIHLPGHFPFIF